MKHIGVSAHNPTSTEAAQTAILTSKPEVLYRPSLSVYSILVVLLLSDVQYPAAQDSVSRFESVSGSETVADCQVLNDRRNAESPSIVL